MGVVYYANYFAWFEVGRADHLRQKGMSYRELESQSLYLPVVDAQCRYIKPAHYDDLLQITTKAHMPNRARVHFEYEIHRLEDGDLLAAGTTHHVAIGDHRKPRRLPVEIARLLT